MKLPTLVIILFSLTLGACRSVTSETVHRYRLTNLEVTNRAPKKANYRIGLGPIELPDYIDRPQIVRRDSRDRLLVYSSELWSNGLEESLKEALAAELLKQNDNFQIEFYPWYRTAQVNRQIVLDIGKFDANSEKTATLAGKIKFVSQEKQAEAIEADFHLEEKMNDGSVPEQVTAMQSLISQLAELISSTLTTNQKHGEVLGKAHYGDEPRQSGDY